MRVIKIVSEMLSANNYLIINGEDAVLIDASISVQEIKSHLRELGDDTRLKAIILTHEHFDHIKSLDELIRKYKVPVYIHELGKKSLFKSEENLSYLDEPFEIKEKEYIKTFKDDEDILIGDMLIKCIHTPGHSKGSSVFIIENNMFTGDTIFKQGIGRVDMFGGDERVEKISLEKIKLLSDDIATFYPGHGDNFDKDDFLYNVNYYLGE